MVADHRGVVDRLAVVEDQGRHLVQRIEGADAFVAVGIGDFQGDGGGQAAFVSEHANLARKRRQGGVKEPHYCFPEEADHGVEDWSLDLSSSRPRTTPARFRKSPPCWMAASRWSPPAAGLPEPDETESTFVGNALLKARHAADLSGMIAMADDSGCRHGAGRRAGHLFGALGRPGQGLRHGHGKVEERLEETGSDDRSAWFTSALAVAWPDGPAVVVQGEVHGTLTFPPRGTRGFGYDPIFIPEASTRPSARWSRPPRTP
jgi:non-canonical purine NTP pyrophosphatase (RdgB/HAM1 family)